MRIAESSLDDLLSETVEALRRSGLEVEPTKGAARELIGVTLELSNPRSRLSVTESRGLVFSCLGEFLWYASGSNALDHIQYYIPRYDEFSDDGAILNGAYGPRLFAGGSDSQVATVVELLRRKPSSRQAVLQIFGAEDLLKESKDIPCTCILQFLVREGRLHLVVMMRSNDAFVGLPHDLFAFTMLQEMVARSLGVELGTYLHMVGSLHIYKHDLQKASEYLREGWQEDMPMPKMPPGDPWPAMSQLVDIEKTLRNGMPVDYGDLDDYWADLARLLEVFSLFRKRSPSRANLRKVATLKSMMTSSVYERYIQRRERP